MQGNVDINKENVSVENTEKTLEGTEKNIEDLDRSVHSLPAVDKEGNSECPFAEELYAKKEKLQEKLQSQLKELYKILEAIEAEISRCRNNLTVVTSHQNKINGDKVRDHYTEEEARLAARITQLNNMREEVLKAIKACQKAIAEASAKYFPGRKPREWPGLPDDPNSIDTGNSSGDGELDDLFELDK